ncbi:DNA topoisomerase family protein [Thalassotalea litorea]|uniref:DNA topoisomerase family protein n=1 Tax=Thalassotalea litorea TaxID=2020715 RepID=UPI00373536CF
MSKTDKSLFSLHEHALQKANETCPVCDAPLQIKHSKAGSFWGCSQYPQCDYTRPVKEASQFEEQVIAGSECPKCGQTLAVKQGRYGMFIGCSNFPACDHIEHEQEQILDVQCPNCKKGHLQEKNSRFGKTFYACDTYPTCKFAVNHPPVAGACSACDYPLLIKRNMAAGEKLQCANKKCGKFQ